jgi:hypothetical protein
MGLDYSYLLYFKREHLWDALHGVAAFAQPLGPDTRFRFPDGDRFLPLQIWASNVVEYDHDDPKFSFATSLYFQEDEFILEYVHKMGNEDEFRAPPDPDGLKQYSIGFIYLSVYNDLSRYSSSFIEHDLVLFDFAAAGTTMSLLFEESPSIRNRFRQLLGLYGGVGVLFNNEYEGHVFWWNGHEVDLFIRSAYVSPSEITALVEKNEDG